jgi:hypothetical protein
MPIVDISIPSMIIRPLIGSTYEQLRERLKHVSNQSTNLRMLMANVDFPLPIRKKLDTRLMYRFKSKTNLYDPKGQPVPLLSK